AVARLFIALPIVAPPELRRVLAELEAVGPPVRVTPEANLHLTLAFLGNVDTASIDLLAEAMRQAAATVRPFSAALQGLGAFPRRNRPRIVWSGFDATSATALTDLAAAVGHWLDAADLAPPPENRPWRPHLTLARIGGRRGRPAAMHELP